MKAQELLNSFTKKDWHWFEKFMQSPVFNKNNILLSWFLWLKNNRDKKEKNSKKLNELMSAEKPANAAQLHHSSNYFLKNIETYFAWDAWQSDEMSQLLYLLTSCRKRNLTRHFKTVRERFGQYAEQQPLRNPEYFRYRYRAAFEIYQQSMEVGRAGAEQLQALSDWQDLAFVADKLKNGCILLSRRKVLNTTFDTGLLPEVVQFVEARPQMLEHPAIAVYYYGYRTLREPEDEAHFFTLKKLLVTVQSAFPVDELRDVYLLAVNFCINRINLRQDRYLRELLDLYQSGLDAAVFLEHGQISRFTYTNIALLALRMREFNWVRHFIETYRLKLPENQRIVTYHFNLARFHCETGDFDTAMHLLQTTDFDDVLHNLMAKTMLLRMYYETENYSALESLLASFATYIRRKRQVAEQQKTAYLHTIRFVRKLILLRPGDKKGRSTLKQEIMETALVAEKDWLVERLERV